MPQRLIAAMKRVEKLYNLEAGSIVLFGPAVRKLLTGEAGAERNFGILVRDDISVGLKERIPRQFAKELGLPEQYMSRGYHYDDGLFFGTVGSYDPRLRSIKWLRGYPEELTPSDVLISADTLCLQSDGVIVDMCSGIEDIYNGVVRFVGRDHAVKIKERAGLIKALEALTFKHETGFTCDDDTQYIVENLLNKDNNDGVFKAERRVWLNRANENQWEAIYLEAKARKDFASAMRIAYDWLRKKAEGEVEYMQDKDKSSFLAKSRWWLYEHIGPGIVQPQKAMTWAAMNTPAGRFLISWAKKPPEAACEDFEDFVCGNYDMALDSHAEIILTKGKQISQDKYGEWELARSVGRLLSCARDPRAAAREMEEMGMSPILTSAGLDLQAAVNERVRLDDEISGKVPVGMEYLRQDERRFILAILEIISLDSRRALNIFADVSGCYKLTREEAAKYLEERDAYEQAMINGPSGGVAVEKTQLFKAREILLREIRNVTPHRRAMALENLCFRAFRSLGTDPCKKEALRNIAQSERPAGAGRILGEKDIKEILGAEAASQKLAVLEKYILEAEKRGNKSTEKDHLLSAINAAITNTFTAGSEGKPIPPYRVILLENDSENGHDEKGIRVAEGVQKLPAYHFTDPKTKQIVYACTREYLEGLVDFIEGITGTGRKAALGIAAREVFGHEFDEAVLGMSHGKARIRESAGYGALSYKMMFDIKMLGSKQRWERIGNTFGVMAEIEARKDWTAPEIAAAKEIAWRVKTLSAFLNSGYAPPTFFRRLATPDPPLNTFPLGDTAIMSGKASVTKATGKGSRRGQEDRSVNVVVAAGNFPHGKGRLLAVMDGHCGDQVSQMAAKNLRGIFRGALIDHKGNVELALKDAVANLHKESLNHDGGSTISIVYLPNDENRAYTAILGDSPVIIVDKNGQINRSPIHSFSSNPSEVKRAVDNRFSYDGTHVDGIMPSRAIGDESYDNILSRDPDIYSVEIGPKSLILLMTDGVYDPTYDTNADLARMIVMAREKGAKALVKDALAGGLKGGDNATAIVYAGAPIMREPAKDLEMKLPDSRENVLVDQAA